MTINKTQTEEKITFALDGRLDTITAPQLQEVLIPAFGEAAHIELDFSSLTYVSSAGLRVLLMGQKTAKVKGGRQTLVGVSAGIMEVLEMTGFSGILNIE